MDSEIVSRKTLGRGASLCDLYDVRRDQFCGVSLLRSAPPLAAVTSVDVPHTLFESTIEESYHEKFHKLSVEAGLKISVLGGLLSLSGSGKYLNDEASSKKIVRGTLIYKITSKEDSVNLLHNELRSHVITEQFLNPSATHVVSKIRWGANVFVTFERKADSYSQAKDFAGMLQASLQVNFVEISGEANVNYSQKDTHEFSDFSIKVQGDLVLDDQPAPQSVEQVSKFMSMIPQYIAKSNQGKGKPLEIELYPIKLLAVHYGTTIAEDKLKNDIDLATIQSVESEIDNVVHEKQILNDFVADVRDFSEHVAQKDLDECVQYQQRVNIGDAEFRGAVKLAILAIRQNGDSTSVLNDAIMKYHENRHGARNIYTFMDKKRALKSKMDFFKVMKEKDVDFLPKAKFIDSFLAQHDKHDVYVLYYSDALRNTEEEKWQATYPVFMDKVKERNEAPVKPVEDGVGAGMASLTPPKFLVVDVALHPDIRGANRSTIHIEQYSNGRLVTDDVVKNKASALTQNIIFWNQIDKFDRPAQKVALTGLTCPSAIQSQCNSKGRQWVCHRCNQNMQYSYGEHFYCNCGGVLLQDCRFKCSDPEHGSQFSKFISLEKLKDQLSKVFTAVPQVSTSHHSNYAYGSVARFVVFLKENAIIPFHDSVDEYLKYMIECHTDEIDLMHTLVKLHKEYQEEKHLYEKNLAGCSFKSLESLGSPFCRPLMPEVVKRVLAEFPKLPRLGNLLKDEKNLPTNLHHDRCGQNCRVSDDGLSAEHTLGVFNFLSPVALFRPGAAQGNCPVPQERRLYYFEMRVKNPGYARAWGQAPGPAIGFTDDSFPRNQYPGSEPRSYGYHGFSGKLYYSGDSTSVGPTFSTGDTVGAGINYATQTILFTKNGKLVGRTTLEDTDVPLYPTVTLGALDTPGSFTREKVAVNFGQMPFVFDVGFHEVDLPFFGGEVSG